MSGLPDERNMEEIEQDNNLDTFSLGKLLCESCDYIPISRIRLKSYEFNTSAVLDALEFLINSPESNTEMQNSNDVEIIERYGSKMLIIKNLKKISSICEHITALESCKFCLGNFPFQNYLKDIFINLLRVAHLNRIYKGIEYMKSDNTKVPEILQTSMIKNYDVPLKGILYMHEIVLILYQILENLKNNDAFDDVTNIHIFETFADVLQRNYAEAMKTYTNGKHFNIHFTEQEPFTEISKIYDNILNAFITKYLEWARKTDIAYDLSRYKYLWLLDIKNTNKQQTNKLKNLFENINFDVKITEGLTSKSLLQELSEIIKEFKETKPCWFVMIVLGYDKSYPPISRILHYFTHEECPVLSVQPKVFMFLNTSGDINKTHWDYYPGTRNNLNLTDTLLLYDKNRGNQNKNELTVEVLCDIFKEYAEEHHLENMLKILSKNYSFVFENIAFKNCYFSTKFIEEVSSASEITE